MSQRKPKTQISEKEAIVAAYLRSLYPEPHEDLALEEIELSADERHWLVTLGVWRPKPRSPLEKEIQRLEDPATPANTADSGLRADSFTGSSSLFMAKKYGMVNYGSKRIVTS